MVCSILVDGCVFSRYSDAVVSELAPHDRRPSHTVGSRELLELLTALHDRVAQPLAAASLALDLPELAGPDRLRAGAAVSTALAELHAVLCAAGEQLESDRALEPTPWETPGRLETVVRAVVTEALANARKHASPSEVTIAVQGDRDGAVTLELLSDGVRAGSNGHPGVGLRIAALQAHSVGAMLDVGPADRGRWRVRMCLDP
jgi:hypothetical protein